jgi:hypothetical protein
VGITHIRLLGCKVVLARLAGYIEFLEVRVPMTTSEANKAAAAAATLDGASGPRRCEFKQFPVVPESPLSPLRGDKLDPNILYSPLDDIEASSIFSTFAKVT